jgi:hypothetical protein
MPLQLGPNVTQIHLDKARSLRLGAEKHHIYTYTLLFQIKFLENILTRICLQRIRFVKYISNSIIRSNKRYKEKMIYNSPRVCKSLHICLEVSINNPHFVQATVCNVWATFYTNFLHNAQTIFKACLCSPPSSAEFKNKWIYTSTPPVRLHGVVFNLVSIRSTSPYTCFDQTKPAILCWNTPHGLHVCVGYPSPFYSLSYLLTPLYGP